DLRPVSDAFVVAAATVRQSGADPRRQRAPRGRPPRRAGGRSAGGMTSPIFAALDPTDLDRASTIAPPVAPHVGGIKLWLEFFCAHGPDGVRTITAPGLPLFLDLKLHDIPNTVAKSVAALRSLAPAVLTVHAAGGREMIE